MMWLSHVALTRGSHAQLTIWTDSLVPCPQIFQEIPYYPKNDVAICLGVAQAILIIYFDLGRGKLEGVAHRREMRGGNMHMKID